MNLIAMLNRAKVVIFISINEIINFGGKYMKKILTILLSVMMLISLAACKNKDNGIINPVTNPMKEVDSPAAFAELGITDMEFPGDEHISDVKYYIVNKQIAEIDFVNSGHNYRYRASRDLGAGSITGIFSTPTTAISSTIEGVSYNLAAYPEGLSAIWIKGMVTYSLFAEGLTEDSNYEFFRIIELITGIQTEEEQEEATVELPQINEKTTKDYIVLWFEDNGFKDVDYVYESSDTVPEDYVISLSKEGKVHPTDEIICKISTGPAKPEIVKVPDNMLNDTEDDFLEALTSLGMGAKKGTTTYYSTTIKKGNVFCYEDGNFPVGTIIKYNLSRGMYVFDAEEFDGLTKDQAEEYVETLNNLNAHVTLNLEKHETENHEAGKIYKCVGDKDGIKTNVSCRLAVKPTDKRVELPNYVGTYNNPCGTASTCTVNQINYMIELHEDGNPAGYISAQTVPAGKVDPGTCVKLIVSSSMVHLYRVESGYYSKFEGNWYDETEEALMTSDAGLKKFQSVQFETITDVNLPNGSVVEIQIFDEDSNMWNPDYKDGNYSKYTRVKVILNDIRLMGSNK